MLSEIVTSALDNNYGAYQSILTSQLGNQIFAAVDANKDN